VISARNVAEKAHAPPEQGCFGLGFEDNLRGRRQPGRRRRPAKAFLYAASSSDELCEAVLTNAATGGLLHHLPAGPGSAVRADVADHNPELVTHGHVFQTMVLEAEDRLAKRERRADSM
jgi:hypothetical protein